MDKKGFLFTVTVFLVLTYILLSISVWVKGVETSERAFSEFYKESTVELAIEQITPAKMDNVTYTIMNRALHRLNEYSIDHPVKPGAVNESENVQGALSELLTTGAADSQYFESGSDMPLEAQSSLSAWASGLNSSLLAIGVYISDFNVSQFEVSQSSFDKVDYSFNLTLSMKDYSNTTSVARTYHISNSLDITGLVDPAIARESKDQGNPMYRMFFFNKDDYSSQTDVSPVKLAGGQGGQGWIYGPLALANGSAQNVPLWNAITPGNRDRYILVGTYQEIASLGVTAYSQFAGYILTSAPGSIAVPLCNLTSETNTFNPILYSRAPRCEPYLGTPYTGKPFMVVENFNPSLAPLCPEFTASEMARCVLMVNNYLPDEVSSQPTKKRATGGTGVFDVEGVRDFTMCGYYTSSSSAPSYFQRLMKESYSKSSQLYGIETFVIGNYANDYDLYGGLSRLDREFFSGTAGVKIRGMPGCKDFSMCADSPLTGIFEVGPALSDYGLDAIACSSGAGCD